jgi:hypothetical protein
MSSQEIKAYLARIGSKGGKISRRTLTPEQARAMVKAREAKRKPKRLARRANDGAKTRHQGQPPT